MNRYGEYKKIEALWLGTIPSHWDSPQLREILKERKEKVSDKEFSPLSVCKAGIVPQLSTAAKSNAGDNRKAVRKGDFVINSRSDRRGSSGISKYEGSVSLISHVLSPRGDVADNFLHYLLRSHNFIEEFYRNGRGIVADLWTTRFDEMKTITLPLPPRQEQDKIVRYLDAKVGKINKLIKIKQQQIALLKEKKQAIINQAVTKGLDPNAPMKDSGIAWIGQIPQGWKVERLKFLMDKIVDCPHETPHYSADGTYFVIRTADQDCGFLRDTEKMYRLNSQEYQHRIRREPLLKDDIVYGREGERWGLACLVPENNIFCLGQRMMQFRCNNEKILPKFAIWMLNAQYIYHQGTIDTMGSTSPHVNIETIKNYYCIFPCKSEQKYISKYITAISEYTESLIKNVVNEIAALTEYRTRLISDVVTGKIDVRGIPVTKESNKDQENATGVHQWLVQNGEGVYPVDEYDEDEQSE